MAKQITQLPTPPSSRDTSNFNDRADAFVQALPKFATETNELAQEISQISAQNQSALQATKQEITTLKEQFASELTTTIQSNEMRLNNLAKSSQDTLSDLTKQARANLNSVIENKQSDLKSIIDSANANLSAQIAATGTGTGGGFKYKADRNPSITEQNAQIGALWLNTSTAEFFICENAEIGAQIWRGSQSTIISQNNQPTPPTNAAKFTKELSANTSYSFVFSGATDSDGTIEAYEVSEISSSLLEVKNKRVSAGSPHEFVVKVVENDTSISFKVAAIDNAGALSPRIAINLKLLSNQIPTAPTNSGDFAKTIKANSTYNFAFLGSTDPDGSVTHYIVENISQPSLVSVESAEISAGNSHKFTINDISVDETRVSFQVRAKDNRGALSEPVRIETSIKKDKTIYGELGGFGAGLAYNKDHALENGLIAMLDNDNPQSANFANWQTADGSVFVQIPCFWYKVDLNTRIKELYDTPEISISFEPKPGYIRHFGFEKSDGTAYDFVYVSKYLISNSAGWRTAGGVAKFVPNIWACVADNHNYPYASNKSGNMWDRYYNDISFLTGSSKKIPNKYPKTNPTQPGIIGFFSAMKTHPNERVCLHYAPLRMAHYLLAEAHKQQAIKKFGGIAKVPENICAYLQQSVKFPCAISAQTQSASDHNSKVTFTIEQTEYYEQGGGEWYGPHKASLHKQSRQTGSGNPLAYTTHNGQACGIADLGGVYAEADAGILHSNNSTYILKGLDLLPKLTSDNADQVNADYHLVNLTGRSTGSSNKLGNSTQPAFSYDNSTMNKMLDASLIALSSAVSDYGTTAYHSAPNYTPPTGSGYIALYCGGAGGTGSGLLYKNHCALFDVGITISARAVLVPKR